jgi:histone-binding protein RBBP4
MIAEVKLPQPNCEIDARQYHDTRGGSGGFGLGSQGVGQLDVVLKINHDGEVNRARYMPQDKFIIATKTVDGDVLVFDIRKHPSVPPKGDSKCSPQLRCVGHEKEGYGVAWNPQKKGLLLSGANDALVCLWDINGKNMNGDKLDAVRGWGAFVVAKHRVVQIHCVPQILDAFCTHRVHYEQQAVGELARGTTAASFPAVGCDRCGGGQ